ncbi:MAG: YjbQ family protein [Thermoplasmata archaeon]|nr:MAG: YjbQ family protein [Thermoplasmata archaeon]
MKELKIITRNRNEMIDITDEIQKAVEEENFQSGYIIAYTPHTTAAITINEGADPNVQKDIIETLNKIIPRKGYHHLEGNSDAHIKASLLGSSTTVLVENKKLVLGTWQRIFFFEGDGPRHRRVFISLFPR